MVKGDDTIKDVAEKMGTKDKKKKKTQVWTKPKREPTLAEVRKLFGKALEILLITCMNNHIYQFNNETRVQNKGGPIGLKLTGEIADCLMLDWDKKLLAELKKLEMIPELCTRFKDDISIAIETLEKGSKIVQDKIVIDEAKKISDETQK